MVLGHAVSVRLYCGINDLQGVPQLAPIYASNMHWDRRSKIAESELHLGLWCELHYEFHFHRIIAKFGLGVISVGKSESSNVARYNFNKGRLLLPTIEVVVRCTRRV